VFSVRSDVECGILIRILRATPMRNEQKFFSLSARGEPSGHLAEYLHAAAHTKRTKTTKKPSLNEFAVRLVGTVCALTATADCSLRWIKFEFFIIKHFREASAYAPVEAKEGRPPKGRREARAKVRSDGSG
jgi:hypothetical protein